MLTVQPEAQRLLLIDDDQTFTTLVKRNLERNDYVVSVAHDAESGVVQAASGDFDLIILDHYLPDRDGLDTLEELKRLADCPPVIYLTATLDSRVAVSALKAGASDYVIKDGEGEFFILLVASISAALLARHLQQAKEAAEIEVFRARDRYKALAEERALLLKEVNHRVSNSLQLIASFLQMQTRMTDAPDVKDALNEANRRVVAVAQVHRSLYTSDNVQQVALRDYLARLTADIRNAISTEVDVPVVMEVEPVMIEPDRAVAIGIIVTELVLNAMKHGFPNGPGEGGVTISLTRKGEMAEVVVSDDGVGMGAKMNGSASGGSTGLGSVIIKAMAQKLKTAVDYETVPRGTRAVFIFQCDIPEVASAA